MSAEELKCCPHCAGSVEWCECGACGRVWCPVCKVMTEFSAPDECDTLGKERAYTASIWNRRAAPAAGMEKDAELADVLNTTLWLYRRLPHTYGNPTFVDRAILTMAARLGLDDVPAAIKERAALMDNTKAKESPCGS